MAKKRVLSGMRPTGPLHLGHLHGVLQNWLQLQKEYECFYFVADWHALTTEYENPRRIPKNTRELLLEWLSVGLSPEKATLFVQSAIKEHAELYLLFGMIVPVPWLERNPTYKEMLQNLKNKDLTTYGFLGYPVLQAADILIYKAEKVPVGVDQLPHLELTREIARRFNYLYEREVFPLPEPILSQEAAKVPGLDGRKMSKSYGNAIFLNDSEAEVQKKILYMVTDTERPRKSDPGDPENRCVAFNLIKLYTPQERIQEIIEDCKAARLGCKDCKRELAERVVEALRPIWDKRVELEKQKDLFEEIVSEGNRRAREVAQTTLEEAKEILWGISYF
ncbi:tryptophan--tRNA ligase [Thermosulfurimonas dismutans]|uniref:Tryptophan--tRNA ligase n=1 Tax=Thermosulfurimonas dismutans TaxID=999894 RepID=A0A179D434_9BACT|nr:tryptophan--tRNA ligase [Thermosulfurimonas dismutans]OAQ20743.1 Tryptophanyl-tRNA synthetase [Thermosulfurimonas dismutans]